MKLHKKHWLLNSPIAHRGLHSEKSPENTISAFKLAIQEDHPIELDIQVLKDGSIVVFHDDNLRRLCGADIPINSITLKQLKEFKVGGTEAIPTLEETLSFINNQVPVLIEIKNEKASNKILHNETLEILKKYEGEYAIQSFNPITVRFFLKHLPKIPVGQISGSFSDTKMSFLKKIYLKNVFDSYIVRPDFIAYEWSEIFSVSNIILNKLLKVPIIAWTITNENQKEEVKLIAANYIFENNQSQP